jgi:hypothetical protein
LRIDHINVTPENASPEERSEAVLAEVRTHTGVIVAAMQGAVLQGSIQVETALSNIQMMHPPAAMLESSTAP